MPVPVLLYGGNFHGIHTIDYYDRHCLLHDVRDWKSTARSLGAPRNYWSARIRSFNLFRVVSSAQLNDAREIGPVGFRLTGLFLT